jgi:hypothetical protein
MLHLPSFSKTLGRSNKLTTYQISFKTEWKKLARLPVSGRAYNVDFALFTRDCGRQKYKAHHLCKHLVQAVSEPDIRFWRHVIRRRKALLYCHSPEPTDSGSITDGDDHVWTGYIVVLSGGRWRAINTEQLIGMAKRMRDGDSRNSEEPQSMYTETPCSETHWDPKNLNLMFL